MGRFVYGSELNCLWIRNEGTAVKVTYIEFIYLFIYLK